MIFVDSNLNKLKLQLAKLRDTVGAQFAEEILSDECRHIINDLMKADNRLAVLQNLQAYRKTGSEKNFGNKAIEVRNAAVSMWIRHAVREVNYERINKSERFAKLLKAAVVSKDYTKINEAIKHGRTRFQNQKFGAWNQSDYTRSLRRRTGQTSFSGVMLADPQEIKKRDEFIAKKQDNVGLKFAGFRIAATALALKLPKYVTRHSTASGAFTKTASAPGDLRMQIINASSVDRKLKERLQYVLRQRAGKTATKVRRLVRGQAANLGFLTGGKGMTLAEFKAQRLKQVDA
jgi:hypothetical protein